LYGKGLNVFIKQVNYNLHRLKPVKNDGNIGLSSDYSMNACNESCLHGFMQIDMLISTVTPIPKGKIPNFADSSNYRVISLSSILGKRFDISISSLLRIIKLALNLNFQLTCVL